MIVVCYTDGHRDIIMNCVSLESTVIRICFKLSDKHVSEVSKMGFYSRKYISWILLIMNICIF